MLAIIGGSGLYDLSSLGSQGLNSLRQESVRTEYAATAVNIDLLETEAGTVAFLPRHGKTHHLPPHKINYRANIAALKKLGANEILAINAVGGINASAGPGSLIVPDQLIDYSWGRASTFFEDNLDSVVHVDFSEPFTAGMRERALRAIKQANEQAADPRLLMEKAVYACTQGPRLETAAEIVRLQRDGCDVVGMTGMPEAVLARELGLDYAMLALSVNWAAGIVPGEITMAEIEAVMAEGMDFLRQVLTLFLRLES